MQLEFAIGIALLLCCIPLFNLGQLYAVFVSFGSLALFIVVCLLGLYAYENMPSKDPTLREHADAANTTENGTTGFLMVLGFIVFGGLLIAHGLGLTSSDGPTMVMNGVPVQQSKESGISKTFSIAATFIFFLAWWIGGMRSSHKATIAAKKQAKADRKAAGFKR